MLAPHHTEHAELCVCGDAAKDIEYPSAVLDQFNLPAADRERILKGNAMRLLHLS